MSSCPFSEKQTEYVMFHHVLTKVTQADEVKTAFILCSVKLPMLYTAVVTSSHLYNSAHTDAT